MLQGTLAAALDFYTKGELLEGDNQYFCEAVGKKARLQSLPCKSATSVNDQTLHTCWSLEPMRSLPR